MIITDRDSNNSERKITSQRTPRFLKIHLNPSTIAENSTFSFQTKKKNQNLDQTKEQEHNFLIRKALILSQKDDQYKNLDILSRMDF